VGFAKKIPKEIQKKNREKNQLLFLQTISGPTLSPVAALCWLCEPSHSGN